MISSFISMAIISAILLCFKQTQWLGYIGSAVLGLMFPITTSVIGITIGLGFFWLKYRKR